MTNIISKDKYNGHENQNEVEKGIKGNMIVTKVNNDEYINRNLSDDNIEEERHAEPKDKNFLKFEPKAFSTPLCKKNSIENFIKHSSNINDLIIDNDKMEKIALSSDETNQPYMSFYEKISHDFTEIEKVNEKPNVVSKNLEESLKIFPSHSARFKNQYIYDYTKNVYKYNKSRSNFFFESSEIARTEILEDTKTETQKIIQEFQDDHHDVLNDIPPTLKKEIPETLIPIGFVSKKNGRKCKSLNTQDQRPEKEVVLPQKRTKSEILSRETSSKTQGPIRTMPSRKARSKNPYHGGNLNETKLTKSKKKILLNPTDTLTVPQTKTKLPENLTQIRVRRNSTSKTSNIVCNEIKEIIAKIEESQTNTKNTVSNPPEEVAIPENIVPEIGELLEDSASIANAEVKVVDEFSTATNRITEISNQFICRFCGSDYEEKDELEYHLSGEHRIYGREKLLRMEQDWIMKIDKLYHQCKLCETDVEEDDIINHLTEDHSIPGASEYVLRIFPKLPLLTEERLG